jgi:MFS family permease
MTVAQISAFVAAIYLGGLVFQYPIGWMSDRMDRRVLIMGLTAGGAVLTLAGAMLPTPVAGVLALGFIIGGVANPLYSLIIAYTNDFLQPNDMAAASGGLLFINGLGAMLGPPVIGALMERAGADAYFGYVGVLFGLIALYALWRSTRRAAPSAAETSSYAPVLPQASAVALELAQEVAIGRAGESPARRA